MSDAYSIESGELKTSVSVLLSFLSLLHANKMPTRMAIMVITLITCLFIILSFLLKVVNALINGFLLFVCLRLFKHIPRQRQALAMAREQI